MRLTHPIFHAPYEVELPLEEVASSSWKGEEEPEPGDEEPERSGDASAVGEPLFRWRVFDPRLPRDRFVEIGSVCDDVEFEEAPDAEWISGGQNSKSATAMALGRHGNFFQWGFSCDPAQMTESAKLVFLNAICWMRSFDGQCPLVHGGSWTRSSLLRAPSLARTVHAAEGEDRAIGTLEQCVGQPMLEGAGADSGTLAERVERLERWTDLTIEFLHPIADPRGGSRVFLGPDPDLLPLRLSNRRHELFTTLIARWKANPADELAPRVLRNYLDGSTHAPLSSSDDFAAWYGANAKYLFFSDRGGFRWHVDVHARARDRRDAKRREAVEKR